MTSHTSKSGVRISSQPDHVYGDDDLEAEADRLYEWTQELSFDELCATPRVGTAGGIAT